MADDKPKKTKIDLKARLKTTGMGMTSPAAAGVPAPQPMPGLPLPPQPGEDPGRISNVPSSSPSQNPPAAAQQAAPVPAPARAAPLGIAPPPGMSPGIPLPPFGQQPRAAAAPKPTAQAQTIKVEMGEEVEQERKKASKRTALYAVIAALVGAAVGFVAGGSKAAGDRGKLAIEGASAIEKDVKAADEKLKELDDKIMAGSQQLGEKKFPEELLAALAAINVPFDAQNLENRQVGALPGKVLRSLLSYTSAVQDVNKQKDALKNLLTAAQAPMVKAWKEEKDPLVAFAVVFSRNGDKTFAEMAQVKEPFSFKGDWSHEFTVTKLENKKPVEKKTTRWVKGDLTGGDPISLPIDPSGTAGFTNDAFVGRLQKALYDIREVLEGKKDDPQHETAGLMKDGDDLATELHKVSLQH